jgi:hypothetical protein
LENEAIEVSLNLLDKKKQLEEEKSNIIEMEAKQQKKSDVKTQFQSLNAYTDLTIIEKSKDLMERLAKDC